MSMQDLASTEPATENRSSARRFWFRLIDRFFESPILFLIPIALLMALAVVSVSRSEKEYKSVGVLNIARETAIQQIQGDQNGLFVDTPAATVARDITELLGTEVFVQIVAERAGLSDALLRGDLSLDDIRETTTAVPAGDTLLQVASVAPDPQGAFQLVTATIESYREWNLNDTISQAKAAENFYADLVETYDVRVDITEKDLDDYLLTNPEPVGRDRPVEQIIQIERLNAAVTSAQEQYDSAITASEQARLITQQAQTESEQRLKVVDVPQIPDTPESGLKAAVLSIIIFGILGGMLSAVLLVLATLVDRKVRSADDLTVSLGLDVVALIPKFESDKPTGRSRTRKGDRKPGLEAA
jgi:capsular polysaccharide biosynthesis protein